MAERAVLLILDSVDEFLVNHPELSARAMVNLAEFLRNRNAGNSQLTVLFAIRDEHSAVHSLSAQCNETVRVGDAFLGELCSQFGLTVDAVQAAIPDPRLREIVVRPVLFRHVADVLKAGAVGGRSVDGLLKTEGMICELALRQLLRSRRQPDDDAIPEDSQLDGLALIAWCFYGHSAYGSGTLAIESVLDLAARKAMVWERHCTARGMNRGDSTLEAFRRVVEREQCVRYLNGTVFFPVDAATFRFIHSLWQDFLMGRYLSLCINTRILSGTGRSGLQAVCDEVGFHFVGPMRVPDLAVAEVVRARKETGKELVFANYCAFVTVNPAATLEPSGLTALLGHLAELSPPLRLVDCIALVHRVVYGERPESPLRGILLRHLRGAAGGEGPDPVYTSLCSLYLEMLGDPN